jgi:hypothetical protein
LASQFLRFHRPLKWKHSFLNVLLCWLLCATIFTEPNNA